MSSKDQPRNVIRETDAASIRQAKELVRSARWGALGVLEAGTGDPAVSRVAVSTAQDGTPQIFVSLLSGHTQALLKNPRCSLLLGEPGKGDPLAHPRITLVCDAKKCGPDDTNFSRMLDRHLLKHPKAKLYAGLGDFLFFRLETIRAYLNGGFGRAFHLTGEDLRSPEFQGGSAFEERVFENFSHGAVMFSGVLAALPPGKWDLAGVDTEGMDFIFGERTFRLWFAAPAVSNEEFETTLRTFPQG